jgi:hypothetical protein
MTSSLSCSEKRSDVLDAELVRSSHFFIITAHGPDVLVEERPLAAHGNRGAG